MAPNPIKRGLKVVIELDTGSFTGSKTRIDCYIIEPEYDRLTVSFPESKSDFIPYLSEGTEIKAFIYSFTGIIIVDSIVFDSPYDGRMVIEYNEENHIIQRRKYLRMPYITDMFIVGAERNIRANTIDIGGGGVRFQCSEHLADMDSVSVQLKLAQFEPIIKVDGTILKKNFYKPDEYVLEFMKISEDDRERIVKKCVTLEKEQF